MQECQAVTGPEAVVQLMGLVAQSQLRVPGNEWTVGLEYGVPGSHSGHSPRTRDHDGMVEVVDRAHGAAQEGARVELDLSLHHEQKYGSPPRWEEKDAIGAIMVRVRLLDVLEAKGLRDPQRQDLTVADWRRARSIAWADVKGACFPPAVVHEHGWQWSLVYPLHPAPVQTREVLNALVRAGDLLAATLPGAHRVWPTTKLRVEGLLCSDAKAGGMRLLLLDRSHRYHPWKLHEQATQLLETMRRLHPPHSPRCEGPPPPAMSIHTLPPKWDVEDLSLSSRHRQMVTTGSDDDGVMLFSVVDSIVAEMARNGHGWPDVEELLDYPQARLGPLLGRQRLTRHGLKSLFREGVGHRDPRFRTRLPWGVRHIDRIAAAEPDEPLRFRLVVRNAGATDRLEVSWDELSSARRLRATLARRLEATLPPLGQQVWEAVLRLAKLDPRVYRRLVRRDPTFPPPLTDDIRAFLRTATPYDADVVGLSPISDAGWPVIRDGVVLFPRKVLERFLRRRRPGTKLGRKDLTRALQSMGASSAGVHRFGASGAIRVSQSPLPAPADQRTQKTR